MPESRSRLARRQWSAAADAATGSSSQDSERLVRAAWTLKTTAASDRIARNGRRLCQGSDNASSTSVRVTGYVDDRREIRSLPLHYQRAVCPAFEKVPYGGTRRMLGPFG